MTIKVKVLNALMGSGKTTRLMQDVGNLPPSSPVIYIAPLLSECHRFAGTIPDEDTGEVIRGEDFLPAYDDSHPLIHKMFTHPNNKNSQGTKINSLLKLIRMKENIVSTHALFRCLTEEVVSAIKDSGYILVIDEVLNVWEKYSLSRKDDSDMEDTSSDDEVLQLIKNGFIEVDVNGLMFWQWDKFDAVNTTYEELARLCDSKQLYLSNGKVVFWEYPIHALKAFKEVWIATYMYEASFMCEYLKMHDADVTVEKFGYKPSDFKHLVNVIEDKKLNAVGDGKHALSYNSIVNKGHPNEMLKSNLYNFFRHKTGSKDDERLWTTYKAKRRYISAGRYAKSWIAYSTKATNEYKNAKYVAYLVNPRPSTYLVAMLGSRGVLFDQDAWALSEMVQFIWRSAIRDGKEIVLYIPSQRMREMFKEWIST